MKKTRNNREASVLPKLQPFFPQEGMASVAVVEDRDRHPRAWITGDTIFSLAEQEVARGPITGHYTVVVEDMAEPLFVLWRAQNGAVLHRSARSTAIAFDLSEACAGQRWTSEIMHDFPPLVRSGNHEETFFLTEQEKTYESSLYC